MERMWREIKEYEGLYEVSNFGEVRSIKRKENLYCSVNKGGYLRVALSKNGNVRRYYVHVLVAKHFIENDNPNINTIVLHKIPVLAGGNNSVDNLYWGTNKQNTKDMIDQGRQKMTIGEKCRKNNIIARQKQIEQYTKDGKYLQSFISITEASLAIGAPPKNGNITSCAKGNKKSAYGYVWKYKEI